MEKEGAMHGLDHLNIAIGDWIVMPSPYWPGLWKEPRFHLVSPSRRRGQIVT